MIVFTVNFDHFNAYILNKSILCIIIIIYLLLLVFITLHKSAPWVCADTLLSFMPHPQLLIPRAALPGDTSTQVTGWPYTE